MIKIARNEVLPVMINQYVENPPEALKLQKAIGIRIPPHLHTSAELVYIEEGSALLSIGSLEYTVQHGDFVYIMPSNLHTIIPDTYQTSIFVINCKCDLIESVIKRYDGCKPASPVLRAHDVPRDLPYALSALAHEENDDIAASWLSLVFTMVCSNLRFANMTEGATSDLSSRILAYLGAHYREPLSLDSLANAMGVSRFHLSHMFATKFGIGFKEYLNNLRIECAKGLLRSTELPISEVCINSGFENQRTFNRVFNENTGISPRDYRYGRSEDLTRGKARVRPSLGHYSRTSRLEERQPPREDKIVSPRVSVISDEQVLLIPESAPQTVAATPTKNTTSKASTAKKNTSTASKKPKDAAPGNDKRDQRSPFDKKQPDKSKRTGTAVWLL